LTSANPTAVAIAAIATARGVLLPTTASSAGKNISPARSDSLPVNQLP